MIGGLCNFPRLSLEQCDFYNLFSFIPVPGEQKRTEESGNEVDAPIDISSNMMGSLEISSLYDSKFVIFKLPSNC